MVQWVKDLVLSLQQPKSLPRLEFNPWPRNFCVSWAWPKKKKRYLAEYREQEDLGIFHLYPKAK